jgi:hypothetical protein
MTLMMTSLIQMHHGPPTLPLDGDEPFNHEPMPENGPQPDSPDQQEQEEEKEPEEDTDYTIPDTGLQ